MNPDSWLRRLPICAATLLFPVFLIWLLTALVYVPQPGYIDHIESAVANISLQWHAGRPLYHLADAPWMYSMLYGPACFLSISAWLQVVADPVIASKASGVFWALVGMAALFHACRKSFGTAPALVALGAAVCSCSLLGTPFAMLATFWDRPDPLLMAATSLGLVALTITRPWAAAAVLGFALALAIDAKAHGFLYFLPVGALWARRHGLPSLGWPAVIATVCALAPFALPGISLREYAHWLRLASAHSIKPGLIAENFGALMILLLPLGFLARSLPLPKSWRALQEDDLLFLVLTVTGLLVSIPGAKAGSGATHLLPLAPYTAYLLASSLSKATLRPGVSWASLVAVVWFLAGGSATAVRANGFRKAAQVAEPRQADLELRDLLQRYPPAEMQLGVSDQEHYPQTFCSPRLYRHGAPRFLEISCWMDLQASGQSPAPLERALREKSARYWILPHGGQPFSMVSWYDFRPLFAPSLRSLFLENYALLESTPSWDVYEAR